MSAITLQEKLNARKRLSLQTLKEQGEFIEHCPERGFIYQIVQSITGCITRLTIALKDGYLLILGMEPTEEAA